MIILGVRFRNRDRKLVVSTFAALILVDQNFKRAVMSIKLFAVGTLLALSAYVPNVHAWTLIAEGHISSGIDTTGVFGTAGQDLSGLAYTQSIEISTARSAWERSVDDTYSLVRGGKGPAFDVTIVIMGETFTFTSEAAESGGQEMYIYPAITASGIYSSARGKQANGGTMQSIFAVYSDTGGFISNLSYSQAISQNTTAPSFVYRESRFQTNAESLPGLPSVDFRGKIDNFTIIPSAIPEPTTYGMMFAGLGLLAAISRCKVRLSGFVGRRRRNESPLVFS